MKKIAKVFPSEFQEYLGKMSEIQRNLLEFLENDFDIEENYQNFINIIINDKICENKHNLKSVVYLILKISKNHHRTPYFIDKIEKILLFLKEDIKQHFSISEIFKLFKNHKRILLFLSEEEIVQNGDFINQFNTIPYSLPKYDKLFYPQYFFNEIKLFINETIQEKIKFNENVENFDELRKIGENHRYICQLIRKDSIDEFVSLTRKKNFSFNSKIVNSIFETNYMLMMNEPTLIEYAAFHGSIEIFKFLQSKGVPLTSSIWKYAIHGNNTKLIHILEDNNVEPTDATYVECLKESIKCFHNDIADYIFNVYILGKVDDLSFLYSYGIRKHNYLYFIINPRETINQLGYLCKYDYFDLVNTLFSTGKVKPTKNCKIIILKLLMIFLYIEL